ncbi:MAG: sensor histidine kinase [Bacillaceae bacterium]
MVRKHGMKSLRNKIILQYVLVIFITLVLLQGAVLVFINGYYYNGLEKSIATHIRVSTNFLERYFTYNYFTMNNIHSFILENFHYEPAELQILDRECRVTASTSGFDQNKVIKTPEVKRTIQSGKLEKWKGRDEETNEKIMAMSFPIQLHSKQNIIIRYVISTEKIENTLQNIFFRNLAVTASILIIVLGISIAFTRSLLTPIKEIIDASHKIAQGNFNFKLKENYDGEMGELASTVNYMAKEIQKTEKMQHAFIASVSHELRTPLTSIKGWSETMLIGDEMNDEEAKLAFKIISQESDRLIGLVEELLDFSRLQANQIVLHKTEISLGNTIQAVVSQLKAKAAKRQITLKTNIQANPIISVDENRIKQVLINLVHNAMKYSPPNSTVTVYTAENDEQFLITVEDKGIGIKSTNLEKVRDLFYQEDTKKEGMGIGLSITEQIVNLHQGKLLIDSELGKGTTITIVLPK